MAIHLELVNHFNYMDGNGRIFCKRQDKVRKVAQIVMTAPIFSALYKEWALNVCGKI